MSFDIDRFECFNQRSIKLNLLKSARISFNLIRNAREWSKKKKQQQLGNGNNRKYNLNSNNSEASKNNGKIIVEITTPQHKLTHFIHLSFPKRKKLQKIPTILQSHYGTSKLLTYMYYLLTYPNSGCIIAAFTRLCCYSQKN